MFRPSSLVTRDSCCLNAAKEDVEIVAKCEATSLVPTLSSLASVLFHFVRVSSCGKQCAGDALQRQCIRRLFPQNVLGCEQNLIKSTNSSAKEARKRAVVPPPFPHLHQRQHLPVPTLLCFSSGFYANFDSGQTKGQTQIQNQILIHTQLALQMSLVICRLPTSRPPYFPEATFLSLGPLFQCFSPSLCP